MNNNDKNDIHPSGSSSTSAGGNSGSITDTLKGYVNVAMTKGQEALHMAHEQLSHAASQAQAMAQGTTQDGQQQQHQQQQEQQQSGQQAPQDPFADVDQFNAKSDTNNQNQPAGNTGYKSAK